MTPGAAHRAVQKDVRFFFSCLLIAATPFRVSQDSLPEAGFATSTIPGHPPQPNYACLPFSVMLIPLVLRLQANFYQRVITFEEYQILQKTFNAIDTVSDPIPLNPGNGVKDQGGVVALTLILVHRV